MVIFALIGYARCAPNPDFGTEHEHPEHHEHPKHAEDDEVALTTTEAPAEPPGKKCKLVRATTATNNVNCKGSI